jgi:hypothetical protein
MLRHRAASAVLAGVGACAVVAFAPIAGADDPSCEPPPPDQQLEQCEQNPGADIANQVIDEVGDGVKQGQDGLKQGQGLVKPFIDPQTGKVNPGVVGQRALINGVDTCMPHGVPAPIGADVRIVPGDMTGHCILGP